MQLDRLASAVADWPRRCSALHAHRADAERAVELLDELQVLFGRLRASPADAVPDEGDQPGACFVCALQQPGDRGARWARAEATRHLVEEHLAVVVAVHRGPAAQPSWASLAQLCARARGGLCGPDGFLEARSPAVDGACRAAAELLSQGTQQTAEDAARRFCGMESSPSARVAAALLLLGRVLGVPTGLEALCGALTRLSARGDTLTASDLGTVVQRDLAVPRECAADAVLGVLYGAVAVWRGGALAVLRVSTAIWTAVARNARATTARHGRFQTQSRQREKEKRGKPKAPRYRFKLSAGLRLKHDALATDPEGVDTNTYVACSTLLRALRDAEPDPWLPPVLMRVSDRRRGLRPETPRTPPPRGGRAAASFAGSPAYRSRSPRGEGPEPSEPDAATPPDTPRSCVSTASHTVPPGDWPELRPEDLDNSYDLVSQAV